MPAPRLLPFSRFCCLPVPEFDNGSIYQRVHGAQQPAIPRIKLLQHDLRAKHGTFGYVLLDDGYHGTYRKSISPPCPSPLSKRDRPENSPIAACVRGGTIYVRWLRQQPSAVLKLKILHMSGDLRFAVASLKQAHLLPPHPGHQYRRYPGLQLPDKKKSPGAGVQRTS